MALEITRTAGTAGEDFAASPEALVEEDTIQTQYVIMGGVVIPVDPTSGEGLDSGYAASDSAASAASAEDSSVIA